MKIKKNIAIGLFGFILSFSLLLGLTSRIRVNSLNNDMNQLTEETQGRPIKDDLYYEFNSLNSNSPRISADNLMERPTIGNISILAMPVYFSDQLNSTSFPDINSKWNGSTNSVQDYYLENSFNKLEINTLTKPWVLAPKPISYYAIGSYNYSREVELLQWLFSSWDGEIDFNDINYVYVIYSGADAQDDTHFWPHVWTVDSPYVEAGDGVYYDKFGYVGEFTSMGTYAHEFGHSLGLIDLYSESGDYFCGYWELMAIGNYNDAGNHPAHMSAYSKTEVGWIEESEILIMNESEDNIGLTSLYHLEAPNCPKDQYYAIKVPYSSNQYFLVEFRDNYGYDAFLPDKGVLWSFVNESKGSTEGRLEYIGGDHSDPYLEGVEFDDDETVNTDSFVNWLDSSFEMLVGAVQEYNDYFEVLIDCFHDAGTDWNVYNSLPAGYELYWNITGLETGQIIILFWDTPSEGSGSDFYVRKSNNGSWDNVLIKNNIWQDSLIYRINSTDDYIFAIKNDNAVASMDVFYEIFVCAKPNTHLFNYNNISSLYKRTGQNLPFTASIMVENTYSSWDENVTLTIYFSDELALAPEEFATKTMKTPFKNITSNFYWDLIANGSGIAEINISLNSAYSYDYIIASLTILIDDIKPLVNFTELNNMVYTNINSWLLNWYAVDLDSGIRSFALFENNIYKNSFQFDENSDYLSFNSEDIYNYTIVAYDNVNNSNSDNIQIIYDYSPPELLGILSNTTELSGLYSLSFEMDDNLAGILKVEVYIGDFFIGYASLTNSTGQIIFDIEDFRRPDQINLSMRLELYDNAGNIQIEFFDLSLKSQPLSTPKSIPSNNFFVVFLFIGIIALLRKFKKKNTIC